MITRESSYSELATLKAQYEARIFHNLQQADNRLSMYEATGVRGYMTSASQYMETAQEAYDWAVLAHQLMLTYWNS